MISCSEASLTDSPEKGFEFEFELSKLKALETMTIVTMALVSKIAVILMASMFSIVFTVGIALLLGDLLGKVYYGFFIVATFYLIAGLVFHFFLHAWLKKPIGDSIISQVLEP